MALSLWLAWKVTTLRASMGAAAVLPGTLAIETDEALEPGPAPTVVELRAELEAIRALLMP